MTATAADAQIRKAAGRAAVVFDDLQWTWPIGPGGTEVVPTIEAIESAYIDLIEHLAATKLRAVHALRLNAMLLGQAGTVAISLGIELEQVHLSDYLTPAPRDFHGENS